MTRIRGKSGFLANLLLAALLVAAQASVALHAFEHDVGAPQGKPCATCVTAAHLGAASVGSPAETNLEPATASYDVVAIPAGTSRDILVARQRGPPAPL